MRKVASSFLVVILMTAILLSVNILIPEKVYADNTKGWYLIETKYHLSSNDISIKGAIESRVMGTTSGYLLDRYTAEGTEGNMTLTHSRTYNNGNPVAHVTYQVIWDTPPAYLSSNQKTGFNIESKTISSKSWSSPYVNASFDSADLGPGGATAGYIDFYKEDGNNLVRDGKVYLETKKVIPEGRPEMKKAIILNLGSGYGYVYTYEWKEVAPSAITPATQALDLTGEWNISANNSRGKFSIANQMGAQFSGIVNIESGKTEKLINGNISGSSVSFTRIWDDRDIRQDFIGTLTVDANGNAKIEGTFTQNNRERTGKDYGPYSWTATKVITIVSSPSTPTKPTTPTTPANNNAEPFDSGVRIMWQPAAGLGYRLFRSTVQSELGISVTDFYINKYFLRGCKC